MIWERSSGAELLKGEAHGVSMTDTGVLMLWRQFIQFFFFFQAEDGIRDYKVTGVQTCALPILVAVEFLDAFGGGEQADDADVLRPRLLQPIDRRDRRVGGREHWVEHQHETVGDRKSVV